MCPRVLHFLYVRRALSFLDADDGGGGKSVKEVKSKRRITGRFRKKEGKR